VKVIKNTKNKNLDRLTYIVGIALPISTIPQAYTIIIDKQTAGVSLFTWGFYLLSSSLFAIYGFKHKEKLLIATYTPFVVVELIIVIGLLMY
jgi:uncharacterized protein with PQ loop repeat